VVNVIVSATLLGIPGDVVAVLLGILLFAILLVLIEGIDRV
jgi:hypothetical protein